MLVAGACAPAGGSTARSETSPAAPIETTTSSSDMPTGRSAPRAVGEAGGSGPLVEPEPVWVVGAAPLPLRPDGLGQVLDTPSVLVDRALPTHSSLAPPVGDEFESSIGPLDDALLDRMGPTWSPGCPVSPDELRYLTVSFVGFDGGHHTGELVVHSSVATDVVWVFEQLHAARFPIEEMRLITGADLDVPPTGDGNNTAAFICRPVRGGSTWSEHAYGLAIDINPFHNPYVRGDLVLPDLASAYLDRGWERPGMIVAGDVVTEAFAAIGWSWGGTWSSPDLMHFSQRGR